MDFWILYVTLLPLVLIAAAIGAGILGCKGRIGTHQVCRKCGYNLTGKPAGSLHCPECGSDLTNKRTICIGDRRPRWILRVLAVLLLISGGVVIYNWRSYQWTILSEDLTPTWWLLHRAKGNRPNSPSYITWLAHRYSENRLSPVEKTELVDVILKSGDRDIPESWCNIVEQARADRSVSDTKWGDFWLSNTKCVFKVRAKVTRGIPIPLQLNVYDSESHNEIIRGLTAVTPASFAWDISYSAIAINGLTWMPPGETLFGANGVQYVIVPPEILAQLRNGPQEITLAISAHDPSNPNRQIHMSVSAHFELLPENVSSVNLIRPTAQDKNAMIAATQVGIHRGHRQETKVSADFAGPTIRVKGKAFIVIDGHEHEVRGEWSDYLTSEIYWGMYEIEGPIPDRADLVFRPDPQSAMYTLDIFEIWGDEIVFKDVPIK